MRNNVTPGWLGFWEIRARSRTDAHPRRHGNTKHGRYAKGRLTWWQAFAKAQTSVPLG